MTYQSEVLADTPTLYWRLGESAGPTAADASGNGNTGTYFGSPTYSVAGFVAGNTAISLAADDFNSNGAKSAVWSGGPYSAFALEAIVRFDDLREAYGYQFICGFNGPGVGNLEISLVNVGVGDNEIALIWTGGSGNHLLYSGVPAATASTYHIVGTYDGTDAKLYINGTLVATDSAHSGETVTVPGTQFFYAGEDGGGGDGVNGTLDEVAFYPAVLSAARVTVHAAFLTFNQNVVPPLLSAAPTLFAPSVGKKTTPTGASPALYVVKMVDPTGLNPTTLASAQPEDITWTLNQPTEATFSFPKPAYTETQVPCRGTAAGAREVQIYRDDDLMFFGPMILPQSSGSKGDVVCNCADPLETLNRRNIDAPQVNLLNNGSFESGFTSWSHTGSFTATTDSTRKILGTTSAKFVNATADEDAFKRQDFTVGPNGVGTLITVVAYLFVESLTANALESRGLYIEGGPSGTIADYNYVAIDYQDEILPHGVWIPPEGLQGATGFIVTLWVPPNQVWDCNVRLYAPQGTVWWDAVATVEMDSIGSTTITGSASSEADIAYIARVLVSHVQDSAAGKSQSYVGRNCPANGVKLFRQYQFIDHVGFGQAISEFTQRDDGFDISIEITPTTRTFTTWTPKKGTDRSGSVTLTYGGNVADYRWSRDGPGTVTRATSTGSGSGPAREEGEYADASQIGGTILQEVRQAPPETLVNSLLPLATERVNKTRTPPLILELDIRPSANLIHTLKVGDWVTVAVNDGYTQASGKHRIVKMILHCRTNVLTVFVNEDN